MAEIISLTAQRVAIRFLVSLELAGMTQMKSLSDWHHHYAVGFALEFGW